jgi:hypothetical protein
MAFATKSMGTKDVRVDPKLNQAVWAQGVKNVPKRLRIRLERKRNDEEGAKEKLYTLATIVPGKHLFTLKSISDLRLTIIPFSSPRPAGVTSFKGLQNTTVSDEADEEVEA